MGKKPISLGPLGETVAELLHRHMESEGMKQYELAALSRLSRPTISRIFNGSKAMSVDELDAMCQALGLVTSAVVRQAEAALSASAPRSVSERPPMVDELELAADSSPWEDEQQDGGDW